MNRMLGFVSRAEAVATAATVVRNSRRFIEHLQRTGTAQDNARKRSSRVSARGPFEMQRIYFDAGATYFTTASSLSCFSFDASIRPTTIFIVPGFVAASNPRPLS